MPVPPPKEIELLRSENALRYDSREATGRTHFPVAVWSLSWRNVLPTLLSSSFDAVTPNFHSIFCSVDMSLYYFPSMEKQMLLGTRYTDS